MQQWKILLADDDPEDREIIQEALVLNGAGTLVRFAENGKDALDVLEACVQTGTLPCLVVLDLNMPKLNGTQTLKQLKANERFKEIPVIIYSTSINPAEQEACMQFGAHSYITKPISFNESLQTAKLFLDFCAA